MASRRRIRRKSCESKKRWATPEEAQNVCRKQMHTENRQGIVPYKCKHCSGYHVAHNNKGYFTPHSAKFA